MADVGCGNGLDLRQIVPQSRSRHAIGLDLSAGMLRSLEDLRQSGFTTESGAALLSREFSSVTLRTHDVPLSIPSVQPVIAYVASIREPILAQGSFRTTSNVGVFSCP